jgi:hypothetical protein
MNLLLSKAIRDLLLFGVGIYGIVHEINTEPPIDRPWLLAAMVGLVGLPPFLNIDEKAIRQKIVDHVRQGNGSG